jgi:hypothetical protein
MQTKKWNKKKLPEILLILVCISIFYWLLVRFGFVFSIPKLPEVLCLGKCPSDAKFHTLLSGNRFLNKEKTVEQIINSKIDKNKISIAIEKSKHKLTLYYDRQAVKSYPVVFGEKLAEGDRKTPEGVLYLFAISIPIHNGLNLFGWTIPIHNLGASIFKPKLKGKLLGICRSVVQLASMAYRKTLTTGKRDRVNWTWGCPSLKNKDIDEIYRFVQKGTVVEIFP